MIMEKPYPIDIWSDWKLSDLEYAYDIVLLSEDSSNFSVSWIVWTIV